MKLWDILVDLPVSEVSFVSHALSYTPCKTEKPYKMAMCDAIYSQP